MSQADLYLRLSLDFEGATSIERQEAECRRWCAQHGLLVRRVHVDRGVSGFATTAQRDGFDAALHAVTTGEVGTLVVWKLDRLSRRGVGQVGQVLDRFEQARARLVSVQDQLDTAQPQARMIIALLSEFARAESETMGVRIKSAKLAQRGRGEWLSGKPPFGYAIADDRRLVPVEPAATVMREVFARLAAGHTLISVCRHLNEQGLRNSRGNLWKTSALSTAISSPAYAGLTPDRHVRPDGRHASGRPTIFRDPDTGLEVSCLSGTAKPIVSRATQLQVFEMLEARWSRYGRGYAPRRQAHALLTHGFGRCAGCGNPLYTFHGYRCRITDTSGALTCSSPVNATVRAVDRVVLARWLDAVCGDHEDHVGLRQEVGRRWLPRGGVGARQAAIETELADLAVRLQDADEARYVRGELDAARHACVVRVLQRRHTILSARLGAIRTEANVAPLSDRDFVTTQWERTGHDGRRALLRLAWSRITVRKADGPGGRFDPARVRFLA